MMIRFNEMRADNAMTRDEILVAALALPPSEQRILLRSLLELARSRTDQDIPDSEWQTLWFQEIDRRIAAADAGVSESVPVEDALALARARLGR